MCLIEFQFFGEFYRDCWSIEIENLVNSSAIFGELKLKIWLINNN